ncbi:unnamed protein product [Rotaria sp. Silwood1]|nr:unnamed protein product [Rotaria sp. Silwood1]
MRPRTTTCRCSRRRGATPLTVAADPPSTRGRWGQSVGDGAYAVAEGLATFGLWGGITAHGHLPSRLGQPAAALAARHHRHRLDRRVVLLRLAGQPPRQADRRRPQGQGRGRRTLGRARRRLLQPAEVHGGAGQPAQGPALVLLGELLDVDERLRAVRRALPVQRQPDADRPARVRVGGALAGRVRGAGLPRRRHGRVRHRLPDAGPHEGRQHRQRRPRDGRRRGLRRLRELAGLPAVRRPRGLPTHRRHAGDHDDGQRRALDHPGPEEGHRADASRREGGSAARPTRQAAQRAQHLLHAAGAGGHVQQPLRHAAPAPAQLGRAVRADGRRRGHPHLLRQAAQGRQQLGCRRDGAGAAGRAHRVDGTFPAAGGGGARSCPARHAGTGAGHRHATLPGLPHRRGGAESQRGRARQPLLAGGAPLRLHARRRDRVAGHALALPRPHGRGLQGRQHAAGDPPVLADRRRAARRRGTGRRRPASRRAGACAEGGGARTHRALASGP